MRKLKDNELLYRTVDGEKYVHWMAFASNERVHAYRSKGIRCRRFSGELFVSGKDVSKAEEADASFGEYL